MNTKSNKTMMFVALAFCLLPAAGGCDVRIGGWGKAMCAGTLRRRAPIAPGSTIVAETKLGSVSIRGAQVADCNVVAEIVVRAPTQERAERIAEQVAILLEPAEDSLIVKAEHPAPGLKCSVSVSFEIIVPVETDVQCASSYGPVKVADITGDVRATSASGEVAAENIKGSVRLESSYGSVTCRGAGGRSITLKTSSGKITAENIKGSLDAESSYGSVACKDVSGGDIRAVSSSGRVTISKASFGRCDARTSYGSVGAEGLQGKWLKLHSGSGSVSLAESSAERTSVSSSYGRITCREINTADLNVTGSSGDISVAYADSAPGQIAADVKTSYGSIDFAAPRGFAGHLDMSTSYGSVKTDLPVTVIGPTGRDSITGSIGQGAGRLRLRSGSGSIKLRQHKN